MPVHDRVVDAELQALLAAFVGQRLQQALAVRRSVHHVVVGRLGVEQAEAVVVLGGDDDVLDSGFLGKANPFGRIVLDGIELLGQLLVLGHRDVRAVHDPLADAADGLALPRAGGHGVQAPMDEHAEAGVAPPLHPGIALLGRLPIPLGFLRRSQGRGDRQPSQQQNATAGESSGVHVRCPHGAKKSCFGRSSLLPRWATPASGVNAAASVPTSWHSFHPSRRDGVPG